MVDYILKIDIDSSALVRKLNDALKKVQMPGVASGTGSSYGASMGGFAKTVGQGGQGAQLTELGYKRVAEKAAIQDHFRAGQRNIELLKNANMLHRDDVKFQNRMTHLAKVQGNWTAKMFNVGTVVKLAGLATGVAGLLQFRKILIESSPMLQAMLKILNVAVMFILRPIGDFIGFVLRPLLIPFLKFAIAFYTSRLGIVIETGDDLGQAILKGDFGKALDRLLSFGTIITNPEQAKKDLEDRKKLEEEGGGALDFDNFLNVMKLISGGTIGGGLGHIANALNYIKDWYSSISSDSEATGVLMANTPGFLNAISLFVGDMVKFSNEINTDIHPWDTNPPDREPIDWEEEYKNAPPIDFSNWITKSQKTTGINDGVGIGDSISAKVYKPLDKSKYQMTEAERILRDYNDYKKEVEETIAEIINPYGNFANPLGPGGGVGTQKEVDRLQLELETQEDAITALELLDDGSRRTAEKLEKMRVAAAMTEAELHQQTQGLRANKGEFDKLTESITRTRAELESLFGGLGGGVVAGVGGGGSSSGSPYKGIGSSGATVKDSHLGAYGGVSGSRPTAPDFTANYACGGLINEEIWGVGRDTGKFYKMGEQGDEMVIPWGSASQGLDNLKRIGMNASVGGAQENQNVGQFKGISAGRYGRYLAQLQDARQRKQSAQSGLDELGDAPSKGHWNYRYSKGGNNTTNRQRCGWQPNAAYGEWGAAGGTEFTNQLAQAGTDISSYESKLSPYEGQVSADQLQSGKTTDVTNQNSITINVANAQNADDLIAQLGDKLLKFLQDNDSRVGIR